MLQSWRAKMWRIFSQLSLVPAPTNHLHHHRCLTPRVQGPFPPHLAPECLITPQVHLYIVCYFSEMYFFCCFCELFQNLCTGNPMFPRMPMINGLMGPNQQRFSINQGAGPCMPDSFPPLNRMPFTDNPRYPTALSTVFFLYLCWHE